MSARRNRVTSLGAFLLSMFNARSCATVTDEDDVPGGCCAAVPLVEGPCTFVPEADGDALGSAVSPTPVSSCAVASPGRAFALAARSRFLTIVFQTPVLLTNTFQKYSQYQYIYFMKKVLAIPILINELQKYAIHSPILSAILFW